MMSFIYNLSIRNKLLLMLVFPVVGLLFFSVNSMIEKWETAEEMDRITQLAQMGVHLSAVVHETQRERGMTAGYLGSKGAKFAQDLPEQRRRTDEKIAELNEFLEQRSEQYARSTEQALANVQGQITQLGSIRSQVTGQSIAAGQAIGYYTKLNQDMIEIVADLVRIPDDGFVTRAIGAYVALMWAKEDSGIERAVLTNTFAADSFGPGMFVRFAKLVAAQESYLDLFDDLATEEDRELYSTTMDSRYVHAVEEMRKIAFEKGVEGNFGIDSAEWFEKSTGRINLLKKVEDHMSEDLIEDTGNLASQASSTLSFFLGLTVIAVGAAALLSVLMIRAIAGPLKIALDAMNDIAEGEGDLTRRLDASAKDEIGQMADAFNRFADKIQGVLVKVRGMASSIDRSTREIAAGNSDLSQRTEEQASSLEETASSMEEMTSTVRQNADNARQANQLANSAKEQAESGGEVMGNAVNAMGMINDSSRKIADIITVIDEIAFQTNLLALNAAVEAARAGEQGRGFAVVAGEVRNLAQRSAESAKEIKDLIEDSVGKVEQGSELVSKAGDTLRGIVDGVKRVTDIVSEIAAASNEQAAGIEQVNKAVMQMDEVTQQNAALVEQAAAASRSMEEQTEGLMAQINFFQLGDDAEIAPAPVVRQTAPVAARPSRPAAPARNSEPKAPARPQVSRKPQAEDEDWEEF